MGFLALSNSRLLADLVKRVVFLPQIFANLFWRNKSESTQVVGVFANGTWLIGQASEI